MSLFSGIMQASAICFQANSKSNVPVAWIIDYRASNRPQQFWIIVKFSTENEVLDQVLVVLELSLTGHYDHGKVT